MFKLQKLKCPDCLGTKLVKNGRKKDGTQNYLCKNCGRQFVSSYKYKGANPITKKLIIKYLSRNTGIRDAANLLDVSPACVLKNLRKEAQKCKITPRKSAYDSVQIDELWSYVGNKKKGKRWLIYAYAPESKEIIGYVLGSRGIKTVKKLYKMLQNLSIKQYCTDKWKAFMNVFRRENHCIGKEFTRDIEGVNTSLRARNRRLVRKTNVFLRK